MKAATLLLVSFLLLACQAESGLWLPPPDGDVDPDAQDAGNDTQDTQDIQDGGDVQEGPVCGNQIIEEGEVCDDGNQITGDGCNATCTLIDSLDFVGNKETAGDQDSPTWVTHDATLVLLYTDWSSSDGEGASVRARFFSATGDRAQEIQINTSTEGNQHSPTAAVGPDGTIFVAWVNEGTGPQAHRGIRGRIFDADGNLLTGEFQIDQTDDGEDLHPVVACSPEGIFHVIWVASGGADGADLMGRFFTATGAPQTNSITGDTGEYLLPIPTEGLQIRPQLQPFPGNQWLLIYEDYSPTFDTDPPGITGQILEADGLAGSAFAVNYVTVGKQAEPTIAITNTHLAACWIDNSHTVDPWVWGIHCRLFQHDLTPLGPDFQATEATLSSQIKPALLRTESDLLLLWEDWGALDGNGAAVRGRRFDTGGQFTTGEFGLNTTRTGHQTRPVGASCGGLYWLAWEDSSQEPPDQSGSAIRIRLRTSTQLSD